jgi:molybdate-binding protein
MLTVVLVAGCDPAVAILADWLARRRSPVNVVALPCSSKTALEDLLRGQVHAAGVHLRDPDSGEYNLAPVRRLLRERPAVLVNFARWELGLATTSGNPPWNRRVCRLQSVRRADSKPRKRVRRPSSHG